jgi:hypothetical protein
MGIRAWASGTMGVERFEAPVELPGWSERPWVAVRALTEAEALERESLGLIEEYEVVARGLGEPELRVRRVYDLVAMAEYEWGKCLVDWCLPEAQTLTPGPSPMRPQTVAGRGGGTTTTSAAQRADIGPALKYRAGRERPSGTRRVGSVSWWRGGWVAVILRATGSFCGGWGPVWALGCARCWSA